MAALKRAFPRSVTLQYANFMPGEWLPDNDHHHLAGVYQAARKLGVGVGGPDMQPYKRGQMAHSYPLIRASHGSIPTGVAVQEGNYATADPRTGQPITIAGMMSFAEDYLRVDYVFWCTEEPYYSTKLIPFLAGDDLRRRQSRGVPQAWPMNTGGNVADLEDVARIALSLPGTHPDFGFAVPIKGKYKGFAWTWNERIEPKKPKIPNPEVLAIRTANLEEKESLLAADPDKFFTEPHYNNYPAVLVRLPNIDLAELEELLIDGWRTLATKQMLEEFEAGRSA
jgi:hypothetical protein